MHKTFALALVLGGTLLAGPVHLRCEYLDNPLGIDALSPSLSWQSDNRERNWVQSAYEIRVATSADRLDAPDIWDSGKQASAESVDIVYGGPKLQPRGRYYWTVRVWDAQGHPSGWAPPAWWEMGLLDKTDWNAQWIYWRNPGDEEDRAGIRWIWHPVHDPMSVPPRTVCVFRTTVALSEFPRAAAGMSRPVDEFMRLGGFVALGVPE